jgi:hypothetical protein
MSESSFETRGLLFQYTEKRFSKGRRWSSTQRLGAPLVKSAKAEKAVYPAHLMMFIFTARFRISLYQVA